jgi:hypothetical protein
MKQITIGRNSDNTLVINDTTVSRNHAVLVHTEKGIFIRDNGSSNGTFINGKRIEQEHELKRNDILKLGTVLVPWMNYIDFKSEEKPVQEEKERIEKTTPKEIPTNNGPNRKAAPKIDLPDAPQSVGVGAVKKIFGTFIIIMGIALMAAGVLIHLDGEEPELGMGIVVFGLIILIIGITRVSTRSRSQIRREAQIIAHNKFQAAVIASQYGGDTMSDEVVKKLEKLNDLRKHGIISEQEFQAQKDRLLNG